MRFLLPFATNHVASVTPKNVHDKISNLKSSRFRHSTTKYLVGLEPRFCDGNIIFYCMLDYTILKHTACYQWLQKPRREMDM